MDQDLSLHVQAETIKESNSLEQEASELDTKIDKDEVVCEEGASDNGEMEQFEVIIDVSTGSVEAEALRALARAGTGLPGMNPAAASAASAASAAFAEILKLSLQAQQAGQHTGNQPATGSMCNEEKIDSDDTDDSFHNIENENEVRIIL